METKDLHFWNKIFFFTKNIMKRYMDRFFLINFISSPLCSGRHSSGRSDSVHCCCFYCFILCGTVRNGPENNDTNSSKAPLTNPVTSVITICYSKRICLLGNWVTQKLVYVTEFFNVFYCHDFKLLMYENIWIVLF